MKSDLKTYSSKDVAKRISIEPVTVRKYSQMLEEHGYCFKKDEKGWRQYSEGDIHALEYIQSMKVMGKSLEESVKHVAGLYRSNLVISQSDISLQESLSSPWEIFLKKQEEFNQKILDRLEAQERRQDERERLLMESIRGMLEARKQAAVSLQKKWWQFWK